VTTEKGTAKITVRGSTYIQNPVNLDDMILTTDGVVRDVNVHASVIQTPGCIYVSRERTGQIENIKFLLTTVSAYSNSVGNKPFFHSEGGSSVTPVTIKSCTFTELPGSLGSLTYNVLEIVGGNMMVIGCTFSDMTMNPSMGGDSAVVVVLEATVTLKNTVFSGIQLETSAAILGSPTSECEWGSFSVIILRDAISIIKDTLISDTYAGVSVHGGTAVIDETNFNSVGTQRNSKYPSVERHLTCGMLLIMCIRNKFLQ
jgi:hypothetical protein